MDTENNGRAFVVSILCDRDSVDSSNGDEDHQNSTNCTNKYDKHNVTQTNDNSERQSAVWTSNATSVLLNLYYKNLEMLETPKKKKRIWIAISEKLNNCYNIVMSPDQVRWKINALTKRYKQCLEKGNHYQFKYFSVMDNIYSKYNVDCDSCLFADSVLDRKVNAQNDKKNIDLNGAKENNAIIKLRKIRMQNRMESDRSQSRVYLERQWLDYLQRQQHQESQRDKKMDRKLELIEHKIELRKRKIEVVQSLECRKIQIREKELDDTLRVEKEKYELLRELYCNGY